MTGGSAGGVAAAEGLVALRRGRALVRCWMLGWRRSRSAWLWAVLVAALIAYDWQSGAPGPGPGSWLGGLYLAGLLGFLAGYDGFIRFEEDRSLRLLLLQPVRSATVTGAFFTASVVVAVGALSAYWAYVLAAGGPAPPGGWPRAWGVAILGAASFVAYALAGSLVLGRDASAVAGLGVLLAGSGPFERLVPPGAPGWVEAAVRGLEVSLPTLDRLVRTAAPETAAPADALLVAGQVGAGLLACAWLLERRRRRGGWRERS